MRQSFFDSALYLRTSMCESFFHLLGTWAPKWANFQNKGYELAAKCCFLTFNEHAQHKILTGGCIRTTKTHPDGVLVAFERPFRTLRWRLEVFEKLFPVELVAAPIARARTLLQARRERRAAYVEKVESRRQTVLAQRLRSRQRVTRQSLRNEQMERTPSVLNRFPILTPPMQLIHTQTGAGYSAVTRSVDVAASMTPPFPLPAHRPKSPQQNEELDAELREAGAGSDDEEITKEEEAKLERKQRAARQTEAAAVEPIRRSLRPRRHSAT
eukprot:SAG31_NODE_4388_length_3277_cov_9.846564_4_plen_270_part_00